MHTPGPWGYTPITLGHPDNARNPIVTFKGGYIARLFSPKSTLAGLTSLAPPLDEVDANAYLLAAAPDLLAALERLDATHFFADTVEHEDWGLYVDEAIPEIRAVYIQAIEAIAKAKGDIA